MVPYEINPIGIVGTGILDRPFKKQNPRMVREAHPYTLYQSRVLYFSVADPQLFIIHHSLLIAEV